MREEIAGLEVQLKALVEKAAGDTELRDLAMLLHKYYGDIAQKLMRLGGTDGRV